MSAYSTTQTAYTDAELLVESLKEMGFNPVVCLDNPQPLTGYMGDYRTADGSGHTTDVTLAMKAHIILPKSQVGGASNDVGFVRGADGKFAAIVSAYDSRSNFAAGKQQTLAATYAEKKVIREAKKLGLRMTGKKPGNGQTQYIFVKA